MHFMDGRYHEIVPNERIVFTYDMYVDDVQLSVSLQTIEFRPVRFGTQLVFTEQGVYFDGHEDPALRQEGTNGLLDTRRRAGAREREDVTAGDRLQLPSLRTT